MAGEKQSGKDRIKGSKMAIHNHPPQGSILICDFDGFKEPEMVKKRPVVVISKPINSRPPLCTIVALSSVPPPVVLPMHCILKFDPLLPPPFDVDPSWVKGDMVYSLCFTRFDFIKTGKNAAGKRTYDYRILSPDDLDRVLKCVIAGIGIVDIKKKEIIPLSL